MRLLQFFYALRDAGIPVATGEYLTLLAALRKAVISPCVDELRDLARCTLVKDEGQYERYERVFDKFIREGSIGLPWGDVETLELEATLEGGDQAASTTAAAFVLKRASERRDGNAGRSRRHPAFRDYDGDMPLNSRGMQLALRRLRRLAREGAACEFDIDQTIRATAKNAGWLDFRFRPVRRNRARLLLLMDVGGSMDEHIRRVEQLFTAVRTEFSAVEFYYFHNCVYEDVWRDNARRNLTRTSTLDLIRRFGGKYQLLFVGDASMSPSEILLAGGAAESRNTEPGLRWLERLAYAFPKHAWLNPEPESTWATRQTIQIVKRALTRGMHPLTVSGLQNAMLDLTK